MKRLLRRALYWLALLAGIIGLAGGGLSLGKYVRARITDPYFDSFSYNDLVFSGSVVFILSLILLIFADIGNIVGKSLSQAKPEKAEPKTAAGPARSSATTFASGPLPALEAEPDRESADEKLTRLLQQKQQKKPE